MTGAIPTTDEQELACKIAQRIDDAGFKQREVAVAARSTRVHGLSRIILDEIMQFNRQQPKREKDQEDFEWGTTQ
jgi:hypothetical protein